MKSFTFILLSFIINQVFAIDRVDLVNKHSLELNKEYLIFTNKFYNKKIKVKDCNKGFLKAIIASFKNENSQKIKINFKNRKLASYSFNGSEVKVDITSKVYKNLISLEKDFDFYVRKAEKKCKK